MRSDRRTFITDLYSDILQSEQWKKSAACKGMDPNLFFSGRYTEEQKQAKKICATCPVKQACREYGLSLGVGEGGIWGGLNQNDRRRVRKHAS